MNSSTPLKDLVSSQSIIIKSRGLTRWIIPLDSLTVNQVISNWSPHSIKAKVLWKVFLSVHRLGLIYRLRRLLKKWILNSSLLEPQPFLTVIYIGTPGPSQKYVVWVIDKNSDKISHIEKIPVGELATQFIENEHKILNFLAAKAMRIGPIILENSAYFGGVAQEILAGKHGRLRYADQHTEVLLKLIRHDVDEAFVEIENLISMLSDHFDKSYDIGLVCRKIKIRFLLPDTFTFKVVIEHGDFCPWNIIVNRDRHIQLVDWESASTEGRPMYDIFHFFYTIDRLLTKGGNVRNMLLSNNAVSRYMEVLELTYEKLDILLLEFFIRKIRDSSIVHDVDQKKYYSLQLLSLCEED